jgi:hypothetical protein
VRGSGRAPGDTRPLENGVSAETRSRKSEAVVRGGGGRAGPTRP